MNKLNGWSIGIDRISYHLSSDGEFHMGVEDEQARWLLYMVVGAFLLGLIVYFVNDEYRFRKIIRSNQNYYSHVDVEKP